jgi:hypothetical protein
MIFNLKYYLTLRWSCQYNIEIILPAISHKKIKLFLKKNGLHLFF